MSQSLIPSKRTRRIVGEKTQQKTQQYESEDDDEATQQYESEDDDATQQQYESEDDEETDEDEATPYDEKVNSPPDLNDLNKELLRDKITELVDLNWFKPAPEMFPCVCAKKYDGHFALVRASSANQPGQYVVMSEMCSVDGFTAVKSNIASAGDTGKLYYKLFDIVHHPVHGDMRSKPYKDRITALRHLCTASATVLEQRSRARRSSGNSDVTSVRGLVLRALQPGGPLKNTVSVAEHTIVQSDNEAKQHAQRWANENDGEGAVLSSSGPMSVRYKRKPRFDGEIQIQKINRNSQNQITSVRGKHPSGSGHDINVRGTKLPQDLRVGEIVTYWSHYGQSGRSNTVYDPALDAQHGRFQRRRNDDAYSSPLNSSSSKAAAVRKKRPAAKAGINTEAAQNVPMYAKISRL